MPETTLAQAWALVEKTYDRWKAAMSIGVQSEWNQKRYKGRYAVFLSGGDVGYETAWCIKGFYGDNLVELIQQAAAYAEEHGSIEEEE